MEKSYLKDIALDTLAILIGSALFGAAFNIFILPNLIITGGATGLSVILNHVFGTPVGLVIIAINVPLFLFSYKKMGASFFIKTLFATIVSSLAIDLLSFLPQYSEDRLLACVFGSVMIGVGLSFIYMRGIMTGGSDLLSRLIKNRFNHISLGRLLLLIDGIVVLFGAVFVFKDVTSAFYSIISIFITSSVIDLMLSGIDRARFCFIISDKYLEIEKNIISVLDRSATVLYGRGSYKGDERYVILCAVKRFEIFRLQKIVADIDKDAFVIYGDATEVFGYGFIPHRQ